ncbi:RNA-directed DNA polymerase, eukaryota [Tanacetum coccineum]
MVTYLKHIGNYTHTQLKSKSFEEIQKLYEKEQKWINDFVPLDSEMVKDSGKEDVNSQKKAASIHVLLMDTRIAIHMMVENTYPLTQEMLSRMLNRRLEVDHESEMAFKLLRSGGLISMWHLNTFLKEAIWCDEPYIIAKGKWKNLAGDCFMINIYGPQDSSTKSSLWNRIADFMHHHKGKFILFGDMNVVRNENESFGSIFSQIEADHFNSFIDLNGLIDLPIGGRLYTWMNKAWTKLSKLDRFLISDEVL